MSAYSTTSPNSVAVPRPETLTLLQDLVGFATVSADSNLELIEYIRGYLKELGIVSRLFYNDDRTKANLYALVGPEDRPGIALSGHTDVVPVAGQDWSTDPWRLVQGDDRVYGRGSCDMKGFIAVVLAAVPEMLKRGLQRPLHLCFSYDEEVGCVGVRSLLAYLHEQANRPAGCIVGEPTGMDVVVGHKGKLTMRCNVTGHACHSSLLPHGINAVEAAAQVIDHLRKLALRRSREGPFDHAFDVPFTTIHTGFVHGGTAVNIVPDHCLFDFEFRHLPGDDPAQLFGEVRGYADSAVVPTLWTEQGARGRFDWSERASFPGLDIEADSDVVQLALRCAGREVTRKVSFGTEAGLFQRIGVPSVVCGPGHIDQAHKPDEYVELAQLARCEQFVRDLVASLAAEAPV